MIFIERSASTTLSLLNNLIIHDLTIKQSVRSPEGPNHLSKLLLADLLKVESQGRHRYYSFSSADVAYVVESMANFVGGYKQSVDIPQNGIKFYRSCYDHMAGYVGVKITEAMLSKGVLDEVDSDFRVTSKGRDWVATLDISVSEISNARRPTAKRCLDWSERKPHIAGQFGAVLLRKFLEKRWVQKVNFSRELILTGEGKRQLDDLFGLRL